MYLRTFRTIALLLGIAVVYAYPLAARATLIFSYEFVPAHVTVGPNDVITMHAVLTNSAASDEHFLGSNIGSASITRGTFFPEYGFSFGPAGNIFAQFSGLDLAPGDTFDFVFGKLSPNPAPAPLGDYAITSSNIGARDAAGVFVTAINSDFSATVTAAVPAPATLALLALGLGGLGWSRRRK